MAVLNSSNYIVNLTRIISSNLTSVSIVLHLSVHRVGQLNFKIGFAVGTSNRSNLNKWMLDVLNMINN